jgi:two-component system, chemotaxis family, chemotaxis protein CheY
MLKKILVVDDSDLIHNMYRLILKKIPGVKQIDASNGVEALKILGEEDGIELILLDINMPLMDGLTFLTVVKREGIYADVPVIIISTEGKEADTLRGLEMGAKGYVTKPFKPADLLKVIEKVSSENNPN